MQGGENRFMWKPALFILFAIGSMLYTASKIVATVLMAIFL
jgi:hypothetical protein